MGTQTEAQSAEDMARTEWLDFCEFGLPDLPKMGNRDSDLHMEFARSHPLTPEQERILAIQDSLFGRPPRVPEGSDVPSPPSDQGSEPGWEAKPLSGPPESSEPTEP